MILNMGFLCMYDLDRREIAMRRHAVIAGAAVHSLQLQNINEFHNP